MAKKKSKKSIIRKPVFMALIGLAIVVLLGVAFILVRHYLPKGTQSEIVATVNGEPIYYSEIQQIKDLISKSPVSGQIPNDSVILDQLINNRVLQQAAKAKGLSVGEKEYTDTMTAYFTQTQTTEADFKKLLEQQNVSFDAFKKDMMERLLILKYLNVTLTPQIDLSEAKLRAYFDANKASFKVPAKIHAAHIIVNSSEKAQTILAELKAGGNFSVLAKKYSFDSSAPNGGDLGWFQEGDLDATFYQAASALDVGKISGVVKTQYGYHIIKLLDRSLPRDMTFDEAKADIESQLRLQQQNTLLLKDLADLKAKATIKTMLVAKPAATTTKLASFDDKGGDICKENGKPIIRLFTTSTCPHCLWVKDGFDSVVKDYVDKGKIAAYHWQLDTGDDLLTPIVETAVPTTEKDLFTKVNPGRGVPTFVFGCRYVRIGNFYEGQNDIAKEKADFKEVIDALLAQS